MLIGFGFDCGVESPPALSRTKRTILQIRPLLISPHHPTPLHSSPVFLSLAKATPVYHGPQSKSLPAPALTYKLLTQLNQKLTLESDTD